jgi:hypothetical protein
MSTGIRDELLVLKGKLELLEKELTDQMMELEVKAEKWAKIDEDAELLIKTKNSVLFLDVGGKKFQTKLDTLLSIKDTLFYKLILTEQIDVTKEIFIDRNNDYFHIILSFLRNKKVNLNGYNNTKLREIYEEAVFYQMSDLVANIEDSLSEVCFVAFEVNGNYMSGTTLAGTQEFECLNNLEDKSLTKGICATSPGIITLTINREVEFEEIEIAGWGGNTGIWATTNGASSKILTSIDKNNWTEVGNTGSTYGNITKVKLTKSKAKYIRIQGTSYTGVGYLRIYKCD